MGEEKIQIPNTHERLDGAIHQFHTSMSKINCDENMTAMISALALLSSDRLGLVERNRVEHIQHVYACVLQNYVQGTMKHNVSSFAVSLTYCWKYYETGLRV